MTPAPPQTQDKVAELIERIGSLSCGLADETAAALEALQAENARLREAKDQAYLERDHLVAALARLYPSGLRPTNILDWDKEWHGCVYIDLPSGQISYHYHDDHAQLFEGLLAYLGEWDGHDKAIVHSRLAAITEPGS